MKNQGVPLLGRCVYWRIYGTLLIDTHPRVYPRIPLDEQSSSSPALWMVWSSHPENQNVKRKQLSTLQQKKHWIFSSHLQVNDQKVLVKSLHFFMFSCFALYLLRTLNVLFLLLRHRVQFPMVNKMLQIYSCFSVGFSFRVHECVYVTLCIEHSEHLS